MTSYLTAAMARQLSTTTICFLSTLWLLGGSPTNALVLAPFDADSECSNATTTTTAAEDARSSSNEFVFIDSHSYVSLDQLWYADDEAIDLFTFPIPADPEVWELVDETDCRNVWRYCGSSTSDILLTQFIARGNVAGTELFIRIEFDFFSEILPHVPLLCTDSVDSADSENVLIVEADDTFTVFSETIPCGTGRRTNGSEGNHQYYELTFIPEDSFELVFRANLSDGSCVNVSRVRVFHHFCPNVTVNYVQYEQTVGGKYAGACVPNAVPIEGPNVTALCTLEGEWHFPPNLTTSDHCVCAPGYYPDNFGIPCVPCSNGTYKSNSGSNECIPCPANSHTTDSGSSFCQCNSAYVRANHLDVSTDCEACALNYFSLDNVCIACPIPGSMSNFGTHLEACMCLNGSASVNETNERNSTFNSTCTSCAPHYYRSPDNESCLLCPLNSFRDPAIHSESSCYCSPGHLTSEGLSVTQVDPCDKCNTSFFLSESRCIPCPAYSSTVELGEAECLCLANTSTPSGSATTTKDDCVCLVGLFRSPSGDCMPCPVNSNRSISVHDDYCPCDAGYARRPDSSLARRCYGPVIGFDSQSFQVLEGSSTHLVTVIVYSSFPVPETVTVGVNISNGSNLVDSLIFQKGEAELEYLVVVQGDEVALETNQLIQIKLFQIGSSYLIGSATQIGNQSYHNAVSLTVREDDVVHIGFTQNNINLSVSQGYLELVVKISTEIAQNLAVQVMPNVSLSVFTVLRTVLTFVPNESRQLTVPIDLSSDTEFLVDAYYVGLSVEPVDKEYLRDEIRLGGRTGLSEQLTMILLPPLNTRRGLSQGAEIGIISFSAALLIAVLALAGVLTYCYCRRQVHKKLYHKGTRNANFEAEQITNDDIEFSDLKSHRHKS